MPNQLAAKTVVKVTELNSLIAKLTHMTTETGRDWRSGREFVWTHGGQDVVDAIREAIPYLQQLRDTHPTEQAVCEAALSQAETMFADYFRRNYPGPDTIIGKPDWHSPKIFQAALHALRSVDALKAAKEAKPI